MNNLILTVCPVGALKTNCYLLANRQTRETVVIDPGAEAAKIQKKCAELNLKPVAVLLTHGHFDHIMAAEETRREYQIPILAGSEEKELLENAVMNSSVMIHTAVTLSADQWLTHGERLELAGFSIQVIHTPGHTAGSLCYYWAEENVLISGDTLFRGGFGRTDFPTGNFPALARSITGRLFVLPGPTAVYPGHGASTDIEKEKRNNMIGDGS